MFHAEGCSKSFVESLRAFSAHCEVSIIATKTSAYGMTECVGSKRSEALQLLNDEYVVMRTTYKCDLSLVGLST